MFDFFVRFFNMKFVLLYLPIVLEIAAAIESVVSRAAGSGLELRPSVKGVKLRVRIERI